MTKLILIYILRTVNLISYFMDTSYLTILIIVSLLIIIIAILYNTLIRKNNNCKESWSGIEVQMKRRYDLIPNLVSTVKGYAKHEKSIFENVAKARSSAMQAGNIGDKAKKENMLTKTLKSLFAVSENYPKLKANENFMNLQEELTDTEDKLQAARRFYNNTVRSLNISIESVPTNIIAKLFKFKHKEFFTLEENEAEIARKPVETKFD